LQRTSKLRIVALYALKARRVFPGRLFRGSIRVPSLRDKSGPTSLFLVVLTISIVISIASISTQPVGSSHSTVPHSHAYADASFSELPQVTGAEATIDASPPSWPNGSSVTFFSVTPTSLVLTWPNARDNVSIVAYRIYKNETLLQTLQGNITSYYATGLNPAAAYVFRVEAGNGTSWTRGPSLTVNMNALTKHSLALFVPGPETAQAGAVLTFTVNATGPNVPTETVSLSASGLPPGAAFPQATGNPISGTFSWNPTTSQGPGNYTITFQASDNQKSLPATGTVLIHVTKGRKAPLVTVPGPQAITPGTFLSFAVVAQDPNLPPSPVNVSAAGLPQGSSFDPTTSIFSWRPTNDQAGVYVLIFTATDQNGIVASKVTITVSGSSAVATLPQTLGADYLTYLPWFLLAGVTVALLYILRLQRRGTKRDKLLKRPIGDGVRPDGVQREGTSGQTTK
jgi:putative Ig domain-containing protein/fibronectin type III domain protein